MLSCLAYSTFKPCVFIQVWAVNNHTHDGHKLLINAKWTINRCINCIRRLHLFWREDTEATIGTFHEIQQINVSRICVRWKKKKNGWKRTFGYRLYGRFTFIAHRSPARVRWHHVQDMIIISSCAPTLQQQRQTFGPEHTRVHTRAHTSRAGSRAAWHVCCRRLEYSRSETQTSSHILQDRSQSGLRAIYVYTRRCVRDSRARVRNQYNNVYGRWIPFRPRTRCIRYTFEDDPRANEPSGRTELRRRSFSFVLFSQISKR